LGAGRIFYGRHTGDEFQALGLGLFDVSLIEMCVEDARYWSAIENIPFPAADGRDLSTESSDAAEPIGLSERNVVSGGAGSVPGNGFGLFHQAIDLSGERTVVNLRGSELWYGPERKHYLSVVFRLPDGRLFSGRFSRKGWIPFSYTPGGVHCSLQQMRVESASALAEKEEIPLPGGLGPKSGSRTQDATNENVPPTSSESPAPPGRAPGGTKEPSRWQLLAHELCKKGKWTQKEIAKMVSKECDVLIDQSMVSRAKYKVEAYNGMPKPPKSSRPTTRRNHSVDPQKLQHVLEDKAFPISDQRPAPLRKQLNRRREKKD
jgi:hypothetical protein